MNLIGAVLVSLWATGWMIAAVGAGLKARVATMAVDSTVTKAKLIKIPGGTT